MFTIIAPEATLTALGALCTLLSIINYVRHREGTYILIGAIATSRSDITHMHFTNLTPYSQSTPYPTRYASAQKDVMLNNWLLRSLYLV
jgi:hypothetical protein